nr:uncharacterized protein LOC128684700 [Cherax quadricarinatus]
MWCTEGQRLSNSIPPNPVPLGHSCFVDAQCQAVVQNTTCQTVCVCATHFVINATANGCNFDYASYGFTSYNGRLVFHLPGVLLPYSWDFAYLFCSGIFAKMFTPRDASEWNWMQQKASGVLDSYVFFPINDKSQEGVPVWNNGTGETSVIIEFSYGVVGNNAILNWGSGSPSATMNILSRCVSMKTAVYIPLVINTPAYIFFTVCALPTPSNSIICEA